MKLTRNRYQHPQSTPRHWFRVGGPFYCNDENDERKLKTQTSGAIKYQTAAAVRRAENQMTRSAVYVTRPFRKKGPSFAIGSRPGLGRQFRLLIYAGRDRRQLLICALLLFESFL